MVLLRWLLLLPLGLGLACVAAFLFTRDAFWLRLGVKVTAWTMAAAGCFLAVLFMQQFVGK